MWEFFKMHWRDGVEILILAALAYHLFLFFRATRGARILTGLLVLLLSLTLALGAAQGQQTVPQPPPLYVASPNNGNGGGG